MLYILYALFFITCIILVVSVLLQPGKTDAGALFTSNVSSTAFSPRGTASVLSKITISAAVVFMISALLISMPALTGNVSVLQGTADAPSENLPATTAADVEEGKTQTITVPPDANGAPATANFSTNSNPSNAAPAR